MANKVYNSIHSKLDDANLIDIMIASKLFGRGMGKSRLRAILAAYPNILMKKQTSAKKRELISSLDGFASKTASTFVKNIRVFKKFLKEIGLTSKLAKKKKKVDKSHKLY